MNFRALQFILFFTAIFIVALSSPIEKPDDDLRKRQLSCVTFEAISEGDLYYLTCTLSS
ncbi:13591_t:CDS:1, partial [Dentiscutata heterogama]